MGDGSPAAYCKDGGGVAHNIYSLLPQTVKMG